MRRIVKFVLVAVLLGIAGLVVSVVRTVRATASIREDVRLDGVQVVKDGYVAVYVVDLAPGEVALVDAGNDPTGKPILDALAKRGLTPQAVKAILLTHGDSDHVAAALRFPAAQVIALAPDVALAEGRARRGPMRLLPPTPSGLRISRTLNGEEALDLSGVSVRAFPVPGHTAGSAAFLMRGVLFLGDSAEAGKDGTLGPGWWFSNDSTAEEERSLRALAARLAPVASEVRAIACAHSAALAGGLGPLTALARGR